MEILTGIVFVLSAVIYPIICASYFILRSQKSKDVNYVLCLIINLPIIILLSLLTLLEIVFWVDAVIFVLFNITCCCVFVYKTKKDLWT